VQAAAIQSHDNGPHGGAQILQQMDVGGSELEDHFGVLHSFIS
jgi:hypothetical protein